MEFKGNITANLPAIDFTETEKFYHFLGFSTIFRSHEWTILKLGEMLLELFIILSLMLKTHGIVLVSE